LELIVKDMIHKRLSAADDSTLCGDQGKKIYLSSQVNCPKCIELMELLNFPKSEAKKLI